MKPVYLDLHIHTSENPDVPNTNYNVDMLLEKVGKICGDHEFLISLTDHNMINKDAYLKLIAKTPNVLLGVELHIRYYGGDKPYHCHLYFNIPAINEDEINKINKILDGLYEKKQSITFADIPTIMDVINRFDKYDILVLPHGGQSHSTFDKAIPDGAKFDTTIERSIYYNLFDGFTARSNDGLERTVDYFKKLGVSEFINLMTCSDNYDNINYPNAKNKDASVFLPTWMYARPTFEGLRLSLSEKSRFEYANKPLDKWAEYIERVYLSNDDIEIDVDLTPGLNVVIGGSSSGKTLFVDSLVNQIYGKIEESKYANFQIGDISIINPSGLKPHYIHQNYIIDIFSNEDKDIDDIDIISKVFPSDPMIDKKIANGLADLKKDLNILIKNVEIIEECKKDFDKIPTLTRLLCKDEVQKNCLKIFYPEQELIDRYEYDITTHNEYIKNLNQINDFINNNPFLENRHDEVQRIKDELQKALEISNFESFIRTIIKTCVDCVDAKLVDENKEAQTKLKNYNNLLETTKRYCKAKKAFDEILDKISKYNISCETKSHTVEGHKLKIKNTFVLSKEKVLNVLNKFLKHQYLIESFSEIQPDNLFESKYSKQTPKVADYSEFEKRVYSEFEKLDKKTYEITTKQGKNFNEISPGWKTSVLLDIILGYDKDIAPLIIDQPEDNLAPGYINHDLIKSIKKIKTKKQIILVSHNATIPMLGDAQNIILCNNENGKIKITSKRLEDSIDNKSMVEYIAEITDGGKSSIKKRVKKYNLKSFRGDYDEA